MQLKQLEYFCAVAEHLNFRRAADALYVTQPLISKQIADLETELGVTLFVRNTRSVQLTQAGRSLYNRADFLIKEFNSLSDRLKKEYDNDEPDRFISIGLEETISKSQITPRIRALKEKYPDISIKIASYSFNALLKGITNDTLDIGFILLPAHRLLSQVQVTILGHDNICLVASKSLASSNDFGELMKAAEDHTLFLLDKNSKGVNFIGNICGELNNSPHYQFLDSPSTIMLYVESGLGVGMLPESMIRSSDMADLYYAPFPSEKSRLCKGAIFKTTNTNNVIDFLLDEFEQNLSSRKMCDECVHELCSNKKSDE